MLWMDQFPPTPESLQDLLHTGKFLNPNQVLQVVGLDGVAQPLSHAHIWKPRLADQIGSRNLHIQRLSKRFEHMMCPFFTPRKFDIGQLSKSFCLHPGDTSLSNGVAASDLGETMVRVENLNNETLRKDSAVCRIEGLEMILKTNSGNGSANNFEQQNAP